MELIRTEDENIAEPFDCFKTPSAFNSHNLTLTVTTPNSEVINELIDDDEGPRVRSEDNQDEKEEEEEGEDIHSMDGPTRFPSSQNVIRMKNKYLFNIDGMSPINERIDRTNRNQIDFNDLDVIRSIVMNAELGRVSLIGINDTEEDDNEENEKMQ